MMNNMTRNLTLAFLVMSLGLISIARAEDEPQGQKPFLQRCTSEETGIAFACDSKWKLTRQLRTLKVTISETPSVEMEISENDQSIHFISELNQEAFENTGRYEPGFHFEHLTYCNRETIKINGYLKDQPQVRVSDFYLIDHNRIHSIKFTVNPKEAWEDHKWLIKEIVDSMHFIKQYPGRKLNLDETDETCEDLIDQETDAIKLFRIDQI